MILRLMPLNNFWYIGSMRLLFVADGRSPIARNWIRHFAEPGAQVFLASTFPCTPDLPLAGLEIVPVAYSGRAPYVPQAPGNSRAIGLRSAIRHWLGPLTIPRAAGRLRSITQQFKPELVHALRIPYEGMLAAEAYAGVPLVVSVWGNDFTLHAPANGLMRHYTSWTMEVADGLHADCQRDIRLGRQWGFEPRRPTLVAPGNGGVRTDLFHPAAAPEKKAVILNARGFRTYVRNDTFFKAIPLVLARRPDAEFRCVGMAEDPQAIKWVRQLGIAGNVRLLPVFSHAEMAAIFRGAQLAVSLGTHDGTPNTLLETMACGCFPIAADLESIREWIQPGKNGLLVDANDPGSVADAILEALEKKDLRQQAAGLNQDIILQRAEYERCMLKAEQFYRRVLSAT